MITMFIGHAPAGYIITTSLLKKVNQLSNRDFKFLFWWGILASILPDFDLLYFYLIDNRQHLHHGYWTHIPLFWFSSMSFILGIGLFKKNITLCLFSIIGLTNLLGHMFLDTIVGKIRWFYPFSTKDFFLFDIPSTYDWWIWNFIFHWTFIIEIIVILLSISLFIKTRTN